MSESIKPARASETDNKKQKKVVVVATSSLN